MKTFKHILSFLFISVLFSVTVSAGNMFSSDISVDNSAEIDDTIQNVSKPGMYLYVDTESEPVVSVSQPDILPVSFKDNISETERLLKRSQRLSLVQACMLRNYDRDFINKSFTKEIIFPFHNFW